MTPSASLADLKFIKLLNACKVVTLHSKRVTDSTQPYMDFLVARCSSVVRAFAHGAMGRRIDPSWGAPIELFLVPASAPRQV